MQLEVGSDEGGQTLLSFLKGHLRNAPSVKSIKRAIDQKRCKINGRVEFFSTHKVRSGDRIEITLAPRKKQVPPTILYEDDQLILYNKPSGLASEAFQKHFLVHRLDKETSGVFLMAKTEEAQMQLSALFAERKVEKRYLAVVDGVISLKQWKVDNFLGEKVRYQGGVLMGKTSKGKGKRAVTTFRVLAVGEGTTLVEAVPLTGRTHQIRVHMKDKGHPILGDWQYAKHFQCPLHPPRLLLHAETLAFTHPATKKRIEVVAPIPADFLAHSPKNPSLSIL